MIKLKEPLLLVDGDILCYKAASVTDGKHYLIHYELDGSEATLIEKYAKDADILMATLADQGCTNIRRATEYEPEPLEHALKILEDSIDTIKNSIVYFTDGIGPMNFYLSRHGSFREKLFEPYKNNREELRRPVHLEHCKNYLIEKHNAYCMPGEYEADDLMAMNQTTNSVICSVDKDLLQVPGHHYNWVKNKYQIITETEGLINLYTQILTGDVTDGIPGLMGIGPKKSEKLLQGITDEQQMYKVVLLKYMEVVPRESLETPEEFLERIVYTINITANLLYLRRSLEDKGFKEPLAGTNT